MAETKRRLKQQVQLSRLRCPTEITPFFPVQAESYGRHVQSGSLDAILCFLFFFFIHLCLFFFSPLHMFCIASPSCIHLFCTLVGVQATDRGLGCRNYMLMCFLYCLITNQGKNTQWWFASYFKFNFFFFSGICRSSAFCIITFFFSFLLLLLWQSEKRLSWDPERDTM